MYILVKLYTDNNFIEHVKKSVCKLSIVVSILSQVKFRIKCKKLKFRMSSISENIRVRLDDTT